jgi:hypothetical protein
MSKDSYKIDNTQDCLISNKIISDVIAQKLTENHEQKTAKNAPLLVHTLAQVRKAASDATYRRAKSKYLTQSYIMDLIDLNNDFQSSYWNTFHCASRLLFDADKMRLTGKYCNNRWCLVCNRIRSAKLINGYFMEISKLDDIHFVTLTVPNVGFRVLRTTVKKMGYTFRRITDKYRKRGITLNGIRKLECTYNETTDNFHPHYHLIVEGRENADNILADWLQRYPDASIKGQDVRPADENAILELFKYFTKVVTRKKGDAKNRYTVHIDALDKINRAFYRLRFFQGFGKIKNKSEEVEKLHAEDVERLFDGSIFEWVQDVSDWVSEYGETLTNNDYYKKIKVNCKGSLKTTIKKQSDGMDERTERKPKRPDKGAGQ